MDGEIIKITNKPNAKEITISKHFRKRIERTNIITEIGIGYVLISFLVDKHHKNGREIHCITNTGMILIFNEETKVLATILIARPEQIERYYNAISLKTPKYLILLGKMHKKRRLNY